MATVGGGAGATGTGSEHLDAGAARRCHLLDVLQQLVQRRHIHRLGEGGLEGAGPGADSTTSSPSATSHSIGQETRGGGASAHHRHKA